MAYVTYAHLADNPGAFELAQVATDEQRRHTVPYELLDLLMRNPIADTSDWQQPDIDATRRALVRIDWALAEADALIDAYLAKRGYKLPLNPAPLVIRSKSRDIARYLLHKNRLSSEGNDPIVRDYKMAIQFLERIANGKIGLDMDDDVAVHKLAAHSGPVVSAGAVVEVNRCSPFKRWIGGWI